WGRRSPPDAGGPSPRLSQNRSRLAAGSLPEWRGSRPGSGHVLTWSASLQQLEWRKERWRLEDRLSNRKVDLTTQHRVGNMSAVPRQQVIEPMNRRDRDVKRVDPRHLGEPCSTNQIPCQGGNFGRDLQKRSF